MTSAHPWKLSIADAYANRYGDVAQDFLTLVVEPSLSALDMKATQIANGPDPAIAAFHGYDHANLIVKTMLAFCLGIQSLWEQQWRGYLRNCVRDLKLEQVTEADIEKAMWGDSLNRLFFAVRGIALEEFVSYRRLDLLQTLGNVCRHGEGKSAVKLRKEHPELWPHWEATNNYPDIPLVYRAPVSSMRIPLALLEELVGGVVLFWLDMQIAGLADMAESDPAVSGTIDLLREKRRLLLPAS